MPRFFSLLLTGLLVPAISSAEPIVTFRLEHYEVTGNTVAEIQKSVLARTPVRSASGVYGGATRWHLETSYRTEPLPGGRCAVLDPKVFLEIKVTLPRLKPGTRITRQAYAEWNRFLGALRAHEKLHALNGKFTAETLERRMANLTTGFDCQRTKEVLDKSSRALIDQISQRDVELDRRTVHGRSQGAFLNMAVDHPQQAQN